MKRLTLCILITLAIIIPIADTQINEVKTFAIELYYLPNKELDRKYILDNITDKISVSLNKKHILPILTHNLKSKWNRAIVINYYPVSDEYNILIASSYVRFPNNFLIPEARNLQTPVVPLLTPNVFIARWAKKTGGLQKACNQIAERATKHFIDEYKTE